MKPNKGIYRLMPVPIGSGRFNYTLVLEPYQYFTVPDKIYGGKDKQASHFCNTYLTTEGSSGLLLTGQAGSGKTEFANMIGNIAINNNMAVIIINKIKLENGLIAYLDSLEDCVLIFDEFAKMFPNIKEQETLLTMFSNSSGGKKFFIIIDNDITGISKFIRNRPGRVRYHLKFDKLDLAVFKEYCDDFNVTGKFYEDLYRLYKKSTVFSFDQLKAIISEHALLPDYSLDKLIGILNVKNLGAREEVIFEYATKEINGVLYKYIPDGALSRINKPYFYEYGDYLYISAKLDGANDSTNQSQDVGSGDNKVDINVRLNVNNENIVNMEDDTIICETDGYKVYLKIIG